MGSLATIIGLLLAIVAVAGVLMGVAWVVIQCILFVKALIDRLTNKEDDYYSKNIHQ
jgi:hypothetical protein